MTKLQKLHTNIKVFPPKSLLMPPSQPREVTRIFLSQAHISAPDILKIIVSNLLLHIRTPIKLMLSA